MKKKLLAFFVLVTVLVSTVSVALAVHPGGSIPIMLSNTSYYAKTVTWEVTSYDADAFNVSIRDWNRTRLLFDNPDGIVISQTYLSYTVTANSILKNISVSAPWFHFIPKENAPQGTYKFEITVKGPNGVLDTIKATGSIEPHDYSILIETVEPTCDHEGYSEYACTCGAITHLNIIPATHTLKKINKIDATCTDTGVEDYWICSKCNRLFSDENGSVEIEKPVIIPTKEHSLTKIDKAEATCTEAGTEAYWLCAVCNHKFSDESGENQISEPIAIPAKGHSEVIDPAVQPTRTETGMTEGKHCSRCGKVLVAQQVIPKLETIYGDVNIDGVVDGRDLLRLARYIAGVGISIDASASDMNGDGNIDGRDVLRLAKQLVGS